MTPPSPPVDLNRQLALMVPHPDSLIPGMPTIAASDPPPPESIITTAARITSEDRQAVYGHPKDNWGRTSEIASALLGFPLSPTQCVQVAVAMKLARLRQTPGHRDSLVDLAGYAWVWSEVEG